jgi:Na+-driven multidrug efflux pump
MAEFLKYTAPIVLAQAVWIVNTLFSSYLISKVGTDSAVAALAVANTLNSLSYILMNGLSGAVGIIIGKTIGEGRVEKIKEYAYTTQLIFIVLGAITAAALLIARHPFVSLYDIGNDASKIAIQLISVLSLTIVGTSYQSACLIGLVKSGGDVSFILKNDSFFIFLVVIPLSITAARLGAPLWLIFLALKSDQILKCIPAAIKINRFRWIKKL